MSDSLADSCLLPEACYTVVRWPGGGDWQTIRADGVVDLRAQYALELADGTLVEVDNRGFRHAPPEMVVRLGVGESVASEHYYFQTSPRFTVARGAHDWLARTVFVANAARFAERVLIDVFAVGLSSVPRWGSR